MEEKILHNGNNRMSGRHRLFLISLFAILIVNLLSISAGAQTVNKLYVTHPQSYDEGKSLVSVVNLQTQTVVSEIYTIATTDKIAYHKQSGNLYIFSSRKGRCEVYDRVTDKMLFSFNTGGPVADFCFSKDGKRLFVSNGSGSKDPQNSVTVIDSYDGEIIYTINTGANAGALEVSTDDKYLYIADRQLGIVSTVEITNYDKLGTFYGGIRPTDLELSWDGRGLFISSANFPYETGNGAGLALVNLGYKTVQGYQSTLENLVKIILPGEDRIIGLDRRGGSSRLAFYDLRAESDYTAISSLNSINLGSTAGDMILTPDGQNILVSFENGVVKAYDITLYQEAYSLSGLKDNSCAGMAIAPVDFNAELEKRQSLITLDPQSDDAREAFFERAYIYRTMGDKNSEVKVYTELAQQYPGTKTEVMSYIRLGDMCYHDLLYANSAEFYNSAFKAYAGYLENTGGQGQVDNNYIFGALEKLGDFSASENKDYLSGVAAALENISVLSVQLTELNYLLAYYLKKQGETKLSRRCLDEVERQMISLNNDKLYKDLRPKIDLLNNEARVMIEAQKFKRAPSIDGDVSDWKDKNSLYLDRRSDLLVNGHQWLDMNDLSAEIRTGYDEQNFYVMGLITDNKLFYSNNTKRDRLIVYLDYGENSGNYLYRSKAGDDKIIRVEILPPTEQNTLFDMKHPGNVQPVMGGQVTETGYSFELKIPMVYLQGFKFDKDVNIGFGLEIWDADSNVPQDPLKIMGWVAPTATIDGDRDFRMLGILSFD